MELPMKNALLKNPIVRKVAAALGLAGLGFVLLNLAFVLDAVFQGIIRLIVRLFAPNAIGPNSSWFWLPPLMHFSFAALIGLLTWLVLRSKLRAFFKATFLTVPMAVVLVTLGMFLGRWPYISYPLGIILVAGVLCLFHRAKQPWLYYYAVILTSLTLAVFTLTGGEI